MRGCARVHGCVDHRHRASAGHGARRKVSELDKAAAALWIVQASLARRLVNGVAAASAVHGVTFADSEVAQAPFTFVES